MNDFRCLKIIHIVLWDGEVNRKVNRMKKELCSFDEQLARLKEAAKVSTDTALSSLFGITQGGFGNAKKRGRIPHKWFVFVATNYGVNLGWLVSGTGPRDTVQCEGESVKALKLRIAELEADNKKLREKVDHYQEEALCAYKQALAAMKY